MYAEIEFLRSRVEDLEDRLMNLASLGGFDQTTYALVRRNLASRLASFIQNAGLRQPPPKWLEFYWTVNRALGLMNKPRSPSEPEFYSALNRQASASVSYRPDFNSLPRPSVFPEQLLPRVLIDVSATAKTSHDSGIQRYVRNFATSAIETGAACPIIIDDGKMYVAYEDHFNYARIEPIDKDILLLLDANWMAIEDGVANVIDEIKSRNGKVVGFFHDVIPLTFPHTCEAQTIKLFNSWFDFIVPRSDAILTSSKVGAQNLRLCIRHLLGADAQRRLALGWVPAPLGIKNSCVSDSPSMASIFLGKSVFISVGTIEPRKGHSIALAAFEQIWLSGQPLVYLIIGKAGWNTGFIQEKVRKHSEFGRLLFWVDDCSDEDLAFAYQNAKALLMPSIEEGFGMPIKEACRYMLPVICSDIPIFREVTEGTALFFKTADRDALTEAIDAFSRGTSDFDSKRYATYCNKSMRVDTVGLMTTMVRGDLYQMNL